MPDSESMKFKPVEPSAPMLNLVAKEIKPEEINSRFVQKLIDYMLRLSAGKGHDESDTRQMVGLAAPQVGASIRLITVDVTADGSNKDQNLEVLINPKITYYSKDMAAGREGCWSCGDVCGIVERSQKVTIHALDKNGNPVSRNFDGFIARIAQHEIDHLDGIRFPDRVPLSKPELLHWVKPKEFQAYRTQWMNWATICPRERWEAIKTGKFVDID